MIIKTWLMHLFEKFTRCAKICGLLLLLLLSFSGADWLGRQTPITWSDYSALTIWTVDHKDEGTNEMIAAKCQNQCLQQKAVFLFWEIIQNWLCSLLWMTAFFVKSYFSGNRPSARKLTYVETHLFGGRSFLLKSTENRSTSWKSTFFLDKRRRLVSMEKVDFME